jgi:hypothetical protein
MIRKFKLAIGFAALVATISGSGLLAGCGQQEEALPTTPEAKKQAIETNPGFTDDQKARYKAQVDENEKAKAQAAEIMKQNQVKAPAPSSP